MNQKRKGISRDRSPCFRFRIGQELGSLRLVTSWLLATEVKAGQLDDWLCHLHFDTVYFLGIRAYR